MENDVLDEEKSSPARGGPPRLGSFVTIAAAILILFGAASRVGKVPDIPALFGIDRQAESRIRREEERLRAAITLGAIPANPEERRPHAGSLPVRMDVLPPTRGEFDIDAYRNGGHPSVSMAVPDAGGNRGDASGGAFPGSIESMYASGGGNEDKPVRPDQPEQYVVAKGDTWVKISKRVLGDAERWQEIMRANPASRNGLTVGMRLVIPE